MKVINNMKNILLSIMICFLLVGTISALDCGENNLGTFKLGETINLRQTCPSCTYVNLSSMTIPPNSTMIYYNEEMTKNGIEYTYDFTPQLNGNYFYVVHGDKDGIDESETFCFSVGDEFGYWFILIGSLLAIIFFIASLVTPEEFFVYISGVLFLIEGIYIMINGFYLVNDVNTRMISFVYLGIGLLFTIGAYIYNSYNLENKNEEEEY